VWLNPKSFLMERLLVVDIQQNETLLEFKRVRTNSALPESTFAFTPPEGAEIVEGVGVR